MNNIIMMEFHLLVILASNGCLCEFYQQLHSLYTARFAIISNACVNILYVHASTEHLVYGRLATILQILSGADINVMPRITLALISIVLHIRKSNLMSLLADIFR